MKSNARCSERGPGGRVHLFRNNRVAGRVRASSTAPLAVLAVLAAVLAGCGRNSDPVADAAAGTPENHVRTVSVVWTDAAIPVRAQGVLARKTESMLSFKVGGIVREVRVRAGDRVKAGAVLATLDLVEIDAAVARAAAAVDKARRDLQRVERLREENVATLEQVQDARTGLDMAEAGLRASEFNRRFAVISAPADGVILSRGFDPDELVEPGKAFLLFAADAAPWVVRAGLSERELVGVHAGSPAKVHLTGRGPLDAEVVQVAGVTDPMTRTIPAEVQLRDMPDGLRSGFVATVQITPDPVVQRPVVPVESLVAGDQRTAQVFLLNPDGRTVRRMAVEVAALDGGEAYLATMVPEGAQIVTSGAEFLTDGGAVVVEP